MLAAGRETRSSRVAQRAGCAAATRVARLFIALVLVLSAVVLPAGHIAHVAAASDGYVDTDVLNLRSDPGTWADILDKMYQGDYVAVLDGPTDDGWYQVEYAGTVGWAYGGYLSIDGQAGWSAWEEPAVGGPSGTAWVAIDGLNVRADASTDAWVMDRLGAGAEVAVVGGIVNGFVPIDYYGQRAWVWSDYLSWDGPVDTGPERWIDVNRSSQTVTLFVGDEPVATFWASMGWDESDDGFYATAIGTYYVYGKHAGLAWTEWGQAYIEDWVGFDPSRVNGFHSWSMDENGNVLPNGAGKTGGCVALEPSDAAALYDFATSGMRVEVHW